MTAPGTAHSGRSSAPVMARPTMAATPSKKPPAHTEAFGVTRLAATREVKAGRAPGASPQFVNSGRNSKKA